MARMAAHLALALALTAALAACRGRPAPDDPALEAAQTRLNDTPAAAQTAGADAAIAPAQTVGCALGGSDVITEDCTAQWSGPGADAVLLVGRADSGYRRFRRDPASPAPTLRTADGSEPATTRLRDDGDLLVTVGNDIYILPPATVRGKSRAAN